jgi:hypothetical protein
MIRLTLQKGLGGLGKWPIGDSVDLGRECSRLKTTLLPFNSDQQTWQDHSRTVVAGMRIAD